MLEFVDAGRQGAAGRGVASGQAREGKGAGRRLHFGKEAQAEAVGDAGFNGFDFVVGDVGREFFFLHFPDLGSGVVEDDAKAGDQAVDRKDVVSDGAFVGRGGVEAREPGAVIVEPGGPTLGFDGEAGGGETEVEDAAADRGQQGVGTRRDEEERRVRGRFLEGLEEGVGGFDVHPVGFVDDGDLLRGDGGGDVELGEEGAHRAGLR